MTLSIREQVEQLFDERLKPMGRGHGPACDATPATPSEVLRTVRTDVLALLARAAEQPTPGSEWEGFDVRQARERFRALIVLRYPGDDLTDAQVDECFTDTLQPLLSELTRLRGYFDKPSSASAPRWHESKAAEKAGVDVVDHALNGDPLRGKGWRVELRRLLEAFGDAVAATRSATGAPTLHEVGWFKFRQAILVHIPSAYRSICVALFDEQERIYRTVLRAAPASPSPAAPPSVPKRLWWECADHGVTCSRLPCCDDAVETGENYADHAQPLSAPSPTPEAP